MTFIVDKTHRYEIQSCGKSKLEFYLFVFLKMKYTFNAFYYRPFSYFHGKGSPVSNFEYPNA